jgi:rSAM/selenodomain-associated transferase 1
VLFPNDKLIIFAKAPIAGKVKKRLIPALGENGAAKLHQKMLEGKLLMAMENSIAPVELCCWPDIDHPYFQQIQPRPQLQNQTGDNLGERMAQAMQQSIHEQSNAVLIGTDSPPLDLDYLIKAFQTLQSGVDAVIGPAEDGGYVLIGLSRFDSEIFQGIEWGSEKVFSQTISKLRNLNFNYVALETLWDVDRPDDLLRLGDFFN